MSRLVDVSADGVRVPLSRSRAAEVVRRVLKTERVAHALVSVAFVTDRKMAALNRSHFGRRGATDVISFGFARSRAADPVVGDIYIAPAVARANARAISVPVRHELIRLLVHGTLHVLGHDHPESPEERITSPMWTIQERIVRTLTRPGRDGP